MGNEKASRKRKASIRQWFPYKDLAEVRKRRGEDQERLYFISDTKTTVLNSAAFAIRKSLCTTPRKKAKARKKPHAAPFVYSSHAMSTRAITTAAARNGVLDTRELLESIIHHLPIGDVLNLRSVCRTWKRTIETSVSLCRKLFFKAVPTGDLWVTDTHTNTMIPTSDKQLQALQQQNTNASRYLFARPSQLNTAFLTRASGNDKAPILMRAKYCERLSFVAHPDQIKQNTLWHEMYVCQPPVTEVHMTIRYFDLGRPSSYDEMSQINRRGDIDDQELRIEVTSQYPDVIRYKDLLGAIDAAFETRHPGRDVEEFEIRVFDGPGRRGSEVYMLGALFATQQEVRDVEKSKDKDIWSEETIDFIRGMQREPSSKLS